MRKVGLGVGSACTDVHYVSGRRPGGDTAVTIRAHAPRRKPLSRHDQPTTDDAPPADGGAPHPGDDDPCRAGRGAGGLGCRRRDGPSRRGAEAPPAGAPAAARRLAATASAPGTQQGSPRRAFFRARRPRPPGRDGFSGRRRIIAPRRTSTSRHAKVGSILRSAASPLCGRAAPRAGGSAPRRCAPAAKARHRGRHGLRHDVMQRPI